MVQTRKSFGNLPNDKTLQQKRRSLEIPNVQRIYPVLQETTSYATTIHTSEKQDEDDVYETENDSSFASSQASEDTSYSSETKDMWKYAMIIGVVLLAIVIGLVITNGKHEKTSYENYIESIRSILNTQFSSVSKENRNLLRHIGQRLFLEPENQAPLVVLVGGKSAKEFSEAVNRVIQESKHEKLDSSKIKSIRIESGTNRADFHENLREILGPSLSSQSSPRTAVVLDVDLLRWDAVLVLHAFSDHEKYPVPKTVLFLTVSDANVSAETNTKTCDEEMNSFLTTRWIENGGTSDNIPPIIARISYFLCV
ncbi:unnamed protein product [Caenorhabditis nigoni]